MGINNTSVNRITAQEKKSGDTSLLYHKTEGDIQITHPDAEGVCGYDLLNEPSTSGTMQYDVYDRIYRAIRAIDKNHIIYMQTIWEPTDLSDPELYGWENVVYQYHFYQRNDLTNLDSQLNFINNKVSLINEVT